MIPHTLSSFDDGRVVENPSKNDEKLGPDEPPALKVV
jgi:hypothetical protein